MFSSRKSLIGRPQHQPPSPLTPSVASPRQVATRAYNLACKKLDRDEQKSKQNYTLRERLLLYRTMNHAEEVLQKRTRRTIRRVMDAEEDEEAFGLQKPSQPTSLLGTPAKLIWSSIDDEGVDPDQKLSEERFHETPVVPYHQPSRKPIERTRVPRPPPQEVNFKEETVPMSHIIPRDCNQVNRNSLTNQQKPAVLAL
ncbi:hypothetical protein BGW37DRAFT_466655 [Umbelopsis sp. PMI_123]|nr:hypothetical protein BGW37DRAFT_466655 [Umbelopsis sp. PMI_123]